MKKRFKKKQKRQFLIIFMVLIISIGITYGFMKLRFNDNYFINNGFNNMDQYFNLKSMFNNKLLINYAFNINGDEYDEPVTNLGEYIEILVIMIRLQR